MLKRFALATDILIYWTLMTALYLICAIPWLICKLIGYSPFKQDKNT